MPSHVVRTRKIRLEGELILPRHQVGSEGPDVVDLRILQALSTNAQITVSALAERLGVPPSTCAFRIHALKNHGIIEGSSVHINYEQLGLLLQAIVKIRLASHTREPVARLFNDLTRIPGCIRVFHVTGQDDFYLHVAVRDAHALRELILNEVTIHPIVRQTESQVAFDVKRGVGALPPALINP